MSECDDIYFNRLAEEEEFRENHVRSLGEDIMDYTLMSIIPLGSKMMIRNKVAKILEDKLLEGTEDLLKSVFLKESDEDSVDDHVVNGDEEDEEEILDDDTDEDEEFSSDANSDDDMDSKDLSGDMSENFDFLNDGGE